MQTRAKRRDWEDFLLSAYFGEKYLCDPIAACIDRAYLDFSRTIHGIADRDDKVLIHEAAIDQIKSAIGRLNRTDIQDHDAFDKWHRLACMTLKGVYRRAGLEFYIGQAQKWVNMTMKYIYTFGEKRLPGFSAFYRFGHVPLDKRIVYVLKDYEPPELKLPWSRLERYDDYLRYQHWIRQKFTLLPLDLELFAWKDKSFSLKEHLRS